MGLHYDWGRGSPCEMGKALAWGGVLDQRVFSFNEVFIDLRGIGIIGQ